jgi:hypothetical protein
MFNEQKYIPHSLKCWEVFGTPTPWDKDCSKKGKREQESEADLVKTGGKKFLRTSVEKSNGMAWGQNVVCSDYTVDVSECLLSSVLLTTFLMRLKSVLSSLLPDVLEVLNISPSFPVSDFNCSLIPSFYYGLVCVPNTFFQALRVSASAFALIVVRSCHTFLRPLRCTCSK